MTEGLDAELAAARQRYVDAHPCSRQLAERAAKVLPGGNTRSVLHIEPFAFRVVGADGAILHDGCSGVGNSSPARSAVSSTAAGRTAR